MASLDQQIELAQRHVLEGRRIVTAQRVRIASGEVDGEDAHRLLASFEQSLEIFEQDLAHLLMQRDRKLEP
jgi:hypothetical protein